MDSSMVFARRTASNFSSWEVASEDRSDVNSTVFARFGLKDAALDRNLLPYLLGLREGMVLQPTAE
jgi:hypothetical protein